MNETVNIPLTDMDDVEIGEIVSYNEYDVEVIGIDREAGYATCELPDEDY